MSRAVAPAGLSIDLDDRWTYLRTRGDVEWRRAPSFLPLAVERALELCAARSLRATFFVVGRDAERPELAAAIAAVAAAGHEIGNHSWAHEPWLHRFDRERQADEVVRAEEAIAAASGQRPRGFRGPGHSVTDAVRRVLVERGYLYDASPLPTFVMPIARRLYLRGLPLGAAERRDRRQLGGGFGSAFGSNRPRSIEAGPGGRLVELPVTTFPLLRLPIHFTWLQMLDGTSRRAARGYLGAALVACRRARVAPTLLLHATDLLGQEDAPDLAFFPGMRSPRARKLALVGDGLDRVGRGWRLGTLREVAAAVAPSLAARALEARA